MTEDEDQQFSRDKHVISMNFRFFARSIAMEDADELGLQGARREKFIGNRTRTIRRLRCDFMQNAFLEGIAATHKGRTPLDAAQILVNTLENSNI